MNRGQQMYFCSPTAMRPFCTLVRAAACCDNPPINNDCVCNDDVL